LLDRTRAYTIPHIETQGAISAWIVDDTSFPKKGTHSVGVARQYCGQLGKQENCQVAVSLSIANDHASLPVAYQLYCARGDGVGQRLGAVEKRKLTICSIDAPAAASGPPGSDRPPKSVA
jgi:DDE superfamily endonuclease